MDSLSIVFIGSSHQLICSESIPLLGDFHASDVRHHTPWEQSDFSLLCKPLSYCIARMDIVDLRCNNSLLSLEFVIIFNHRHTSTKAQKKIPLFVTGKLFIWQSLRRWLSLILVVMIFLQSASKYCQVSPR